MAKKKKNKDQRVEVRIRIAGAEATGTPSHRSDGFDRLLERSGGNSFVFIPLATLSGKKRPKAIKAAAVARKKAKLPKGDWYDGELSEVEQRRQHPPGDLVVGTRAGQADVDGGQPRRRGGDERGQDPDLGRAAQAARPRSGIRFSAFSMLPRSLRAGIRMLSDGRSEAAIFGWSVTTDTRPSRQDRNVRYCSAR